jgi:hypothetical protein
MSLRKISAELAVRGHFTSGGKHDGTVGQHVEIVFIPFI